MYEREPLPRVSEAKLVSRPVRQQAAVGGGQAVTATAENAPASATEQLAQAPQSAEQQRAQDGLTTRHLNKPSVR